MSNLPKRPTRGSASSRAARNNGWLSPARWSAIPISCFSMSRRPDSTPGRVRQLWEVIRSYRRQGRTVLITTHYLDEAERLCDRVAIVDHGKVIALGTPHELIVSLGGEHMIEFTLGETQRERFLRGAPLPIGIRSCGSRRCARCTTITVACVSSVSEPHKRSRAVGVPAIARHAARESDHAPRQFGRRFREAGGSPS